MDSKDELPKYSRFDEHAHRRGVGRGRFARRRHIFRLLFLSLVATCLYTAWSRQSVQVSVQKPISTLNVNRLRSEYEHCAKLRSTPHDPSGPREKSARFNGAKPVLIKGATVWTGERESQSADAVVSTLGGKGLAWKQYDVLLEHGLIKRVAANIHEDDLPAGCEVHNATGRLLTTGIVDMHTHAGVSSLPDTNTGNDDNELSSDTTPYVRSLDAINPLDHQIQVIKSGGVTTSLVLPGSGNNIGGEAFVIKHAVGKADGRPEISAEDMLADPEHNWRYMKMACGENAKRVYGRIGRDFGPFSRMGEAWYFRHAFEKARELVAAQDDWCAAADVHGAEAMESYLPLDLERESLAAVMRGQVHVNTHCYTVADLEAFIRHSNEFKFPVRAFHHAHQTYLVPEILKRNYGGRPPAAALFADNMYYKVESYIGSEQAGKILYENGITPVYVSDNPVLNAQHVVFEAAKAHKYGLPYDVAMESVTSAPAELLGLGERVGKLKAGFDADVVLWDSDPLSVGATPVQVWIDGQAQFPDPYELVKAPAEPLLLSADVSVQAPSPTHHDRVCFSGIKHSLLGGEFDSSSVGALTVDTAKPRAYRWSDDCDSDEATIVKLADGYVVPGALAFGSLLGLDQIAGESTTNDGANSAESYSAAIDGLSFKSKSMYAAYAAGITRAISAPEYEGGGRKGRSAGFVLNAKHALESYAVWNSAASVHHSLIEGVKNGKTPSVSSAVAELKIKLLKAIEDKSTKPSISYEHEDLKRVARGQAALVIDAHKADTIAILINLKQAVDQLIADSWTEKKPSPKLKLVILGGAESWIVAKELADAQVGVVLAPAFPYAKDWDQRRSLTGAPLTNGTAIDILHAAGVKLALGTGEDWETRDLFLTAGIARANSGGKISEKQALDMISLNIYEMLGIETHTEQDFVITEGNPLHIQSRVRAVYDHIGAVNIWS